MLFVDKIGELKNASITEKKSNESYPVGLVSYPDGTQITIYFVHYHSFIEAKEAFIKRVDRICDNIVVILMVRELTPDIIESFKLIKYKKKCIYGITDCDISCDSDFIKFDKMSNSKKDILSFKSYLTGKRIIDDVNFDFYRFVFED